ncbi:EutN/CcmL family microcompartment protein [Bacillus sp. FJAT-49705]|uniref:Ethanolamine utilization protein EutN n=2 Tax=Cytobacillus TaxID=2675230 RepID=A0A5B8Z7R9_CYTDA|nr:MULTISPECIES: EutN/CcmL family microcompartment protein [Cytobacillus]MBS4189444.1 EutN/CcmL family microcompartment protein [Cytobacillus citreus]QED47739.1 ethanolamine utilization protein EutN [Cytobacillus dafuensis]
MQMGIVVGRITATRKDENLVGTKLLITQPIGLDGQVLPNPIIAVDTVGAGIGERVIYVTGSMASRAIRNKDAPIDAAIIGIIDSLEGTTLGG